MDDFRPFDALLTEVRRKGISAVNDANVFVLIPALAPMNAKDGSAGVTGQEDATEVN